LVEPSALRRWDLVWHWGLPQKLHRAFREQDRPEALLPMMPMQID
jgi:hypothetical protein